MTVIYALLFCYVIVTLHKYIYTFLEILEIRIGQYKLNVDCFCPIRIYHVQEHGSRELATSPLI